MLIILIKNTENKYWCSLLNKYLQIHTFWINEEHRYLLSKMYSQVWAFVTNSVLFNEIYDSFGQTLVSLMRHNIGGAGWLNVGVEWLDLTSFFGDYLPILYGMCGLSLWKWSSVIILLPYVNYLLKDNPVPCLLAAPRVILREFRLALSQSETMIPVEDSHNTVSKKRHEFLLGVSKMS